MSKQIGTYDAKAKFSEVIREVAAGQRYVITRNGEKVAEIIPYQKPAKRQRGSLKKYIGEPNAHFNDPLDEFREYQ